MQQDSWSIRRKRLPKYAMNADLITCRISIAYLRRKRVLAQRVPRNILQEKDFCLGIDCGGIDFLFQRKSAECLCGMIFVVLLWADSDMGSKEVSRLTPPGRENVK